MKYLANLEQLSIEFKKNSTNLEQYLSGNDPGLSVRWKEMIFLLEFCHDALSPSASDTIYSIPSRKSHLPDSTRIREIEFLLGSLLIDELSLDSPGPGTFESICALRLSPGTKFSSFNIRIDTFAKLSSILGRVSTGTEYLNSWKDGRFSVNEDSSGRCTNLLALSSDLYLLYLALGDAADLKQMITYFRQQKFPGWTHLGPENILHGMNFSSLDQLTPYMRETQITLSEPVRSDTIHICRISSFVLSQANRIPISCLSLR